MQKVDKAFSYMQPKPFDKYTFQPEDAITAPIVKRNCRDPDAENLTIGYRLPGNKDKDALLWI